MIYNLCWRHHRPGRIWLVGPFADSDAACKWAGDARTNPSHNLSWQVVHLPEDAGTHWDIQVWNPKAKAARLP